MDTKLILEKNMPIYTTTKFITYYVSRIAT